MKKLLLFFTICIMLIGIISYLWLNHVTRDVFETPQESTQTIDPQTLEEYFQTKTPFTLLFMGYGGGTHEGGTLTDTIIAAHIELNTKKIYLIAIPRDIWVKNPKDLTYHKINAAYPQNVAKETVSQILGIPIPYQIALNFAGFITSIDTLGGVDVTVNPAFVDTQYPIEGNEKLLCENQTEDQIPNLDALAATTSAELVYPCRYETLDFARGLQHMDGATALKYIRSRHSATDGSDFGRARRQQNLAIAVKQKIFSIGFLPNMISFISSMGADVRTDLTPEDVKTLIFQANNLNTFTIETLSLSDKNYLREGFSENGQNILESIDGTDNWTSVHTWIANTFAGISTPSPAIVQIQNGTRVPGLGQRATKNLENVGMNIKTPINAANRQTANTSVVVYTPSLRNEDKARLEKEFGTALTVVTTSTPSGYNVLVTLGTDYAENTSTN